jgi:hypothetical protein
MSSYLASTPVVQNAAAPSALPRRYMEVVALVVTAAVMTVVTGVVPNPFRTARTVHSNYIANMNQVWNGPIPTDSELQQHALRAPPSCVFRPESFSDKTEGRKWFQTHWEPCDVCCHSERIGPAGDGGKWVCTDNLPKRSGAGNLSDFHVVSVSLTTAAVASVSELAKNSMRCARPSSCGKRCCFGHSPFPHLSVNWPVRAH